jgi:hypothetical protein
MPTITLFHGTAHAFCEFDREFAERGREPNSALGIHLIECPLAASQYARLAAGDRDAGTPFVLVVEADIDKAIVCTDRRAFLGFDREDEELAVDVHGPDGLEIIREYLHPRFAAARSTLMSQGYDAVVCDEIGDDLTGAWVVFDSSRLRVIGRLTLEEAEALDETKQPDGVHLGGDFQLPEEDTVSTCSGDRDAVEDNADRINSPSPF